mmetsp:Transcript_7500/g.14740  ORF Transcript_7500/g.14740 Transcript_7500/m.14740 type:complete len:102 (-) Transcript_7500:1009-1314(-)
MTEGHYYKILEINTSATADEIRQSFHRLARSKHPDKGGNTEDFQQLREAYLTLSDPNTRLLYDRTGQSARFKCKIKNVAYKGAWGQALFTEEHHQRERRQG